MPYTVEDGGRLNNFAEEPRMYRDESNPESRRLAYIITSVVTLALVVGLIAIAKFASNAV